MDIDRICSALRTLQQDVYNLSCEVVSDDHLRPDIRVDRVVKLDSAIKSLRQLEKKLYEIPF